jgi:hypothetical protein
MKEPTGARKHLLWYSGHVNTVRPVARYIIAALMISMVAAASSKSLEKSSSASWEKKDRCQYEV